MQVEGGGGGGEARVVQTESVCMVLFLYESFAHWALCRL